jgi:hypothetical protein
MTVTTPDGLFQFGSNQTAEVPSTPGTANDATPKAPLGALYRANGKVWRYVRLDADEDVATAEGGVAHWHDLAPADGTFTVTSDVSDALGYNLVAGIFGCVVTAGYYTWIQVGGIADKVLLDVTALTGDAVAAFNAKGVKCSYSTTDLRLKCASAATAGTPRAVIYGVVTSATNYTTSAYGAVLLMNLDW